LRVRVSPGKFYAYPDIVVVCGEPQFADDQKDTLLTPKLIVEVLSPSTEGYDRGLKSAQYRTLESLNEYALVSQNEARVEVYRRVPTGGWQLEEFVGLPAISRFECSVALAEIYDKVELTEPLPLPV